MHKLYTIFIILFSFLYISCSGDDNSTSPNLEERFKPEPKPSHYLYVSSRGTNSVKYYNGETGAYIGDFVKPNTAGLGRTQEVLFGPDSNLYVSGRDNTAIQKYDRKTGEFLGNFTSGYRLDEPTKMAYGPDGMLYVSQWGATNKKVAKFDAISGNYRGEATIEDLNLPMGHAWDNDGNFYVVNFGSKDVRKYDKVGNLLSVFVPPGRLQGPVNLWFRNNSLYVIDWQTGTIHSFDSQSGSFKSVYVSGLTRAEGHTIGPDGNLYICDWQTNVINRYNIETGALINTFVNSDGLSNPNSLIFFPSF